MKRKVNGKMMGVALATGAMISSASAAIDPAGFVTEVTDAVSGIETVLTAGLAIVGAFFAWRVLKKALGKAA